jgi:hypothetical protein
MKKRKVPLTRGAKKAVQQDMFPARKKLAEAARIGQLGPPSKSRDPSEWPVIALQGEYKRLDKKITDLDARVQSLAHAVELLAEVTKRAVPPRPAKVWSSEEYIRLSGEHDLMLRVDGEVDYEVLMDVHRCSWDELKLALRHIGKEWADEQKTV